MPNPTPVIAGALLCLAACTTANESATVCPEHEVPLDLDVVAIDHLVTEHPDGYEDARERYFPYAFRAIESDTPHHRKAGEVHYCEVCRTAARAWVAGIASGDPPPTYRTRGVIGADGRVYGQATRDDDPVAEGEASIHEFEALTPPDIEDLSLEEARRHLSRTQLARAGWTQGAAMSLGELELQIDRLQRHIETLESEAPNDQEP